MLLDFSQLPRQIVDTIFVGLLNVVRHGCFMSGASSDHYAVCEASLKYAAQGGEDVPCTPGGKCAAFGFYRCLGI